MSPYQPKHIFHDPHHLRWRYVKLAAGFLSFCFFALVCILLVSLYTHRPLPHPGLGRNLSLNIRENLKAIAGTKTKKDSFAEDYAEDPSPHYVCEISQPRYFCPIKPAKAPLEPEIFAFYVNWADSSFRSLKHNLDEIDVLIPEWYHLADQNGGLLEDDPIEKKKVLRYLQKHKPEMPIIPLVNNFNPESQKWDQRMLEKMLKTPQARRKTIKAILNLLLQNNYAGIHIDFENFSSEYQSDLEKFMQELALSLRPFNLEISQSIPLADPDYNPAHLGLHCDSIFLMAYDEHYPQSSEPGPIASQHWYERGLKLRFLELDPEKYVIALGNYAYDWSSQEVKAYTFGETMHLAKKYSAAPAFERLSLNPSFNYQDADGEHAVWFLDGATAYNQINFARDYKPRGYALWRLGSEDPDLWHFFQAERYPMSNLGNPLTTVEPGYDIIYEGQGEITKVDALPQKGKRKLTYQKDSQYILNAEITIPASPLTITTWGGNNPQKLVLTFDDGPHSEYTPRILDVLKEFDVQATFFVIGSEARKNPKLLKRIVAEGHEIGSHTYSHPHISEIKIPRFRFELNATQRVLESTIKRSTLLFRSPYGENIGTNDPQKADPLILTSGLGYYNVNMDIDPKDWLLDDPQEIVERTLTAALTQQGNVILLHDGGGNPQATVEALPEIISKLRERGFEFVTVGDLVALNKDQIMPPVESVNKTFSYTNQAVFTLPYLLRAFLILMFTVSIALGLFRSFFVGVLATKHYLKIKERKKSKPFQGFKPAVSIVIPAYNEAKVINKTVQALLKSAYPKLEIIVIDDGSQDGTYHKTSRRFAQDPRVHIFNINNGGKARALNFGIRKSKGEIIITLDADTLFAPETIQELIKPFQNKKIGAVAGNVKVGNRINLLTRCQALEYITSQNLDRRAYHLMNCIPVVPGAAGAWRRQALFDVGGFRDHTLAEDADLTFAMILKGYRVVYAEKAIAYTESPDSLSSFAKQRFRWMYGMLQTVWKYRYFTFKKKHGALALFTIPNVFAFQIIFPFISPIIDIMFASSLALLFVQTLELNASLAPLLILFIIPYLIFSFIDFLISAIAFALEKKENKKLVFLVFIQRIIFRQIMYYISVKTILTALKGATVGWNKLERKATAELV